MILYTLHENGYMDFKEKAKLYPEDKFNLYVNLTNKCNCNCTFCLRPLKADHSLWHKGAEPSLEVIENAFTDIPWQQVKEVVICGFGEPTMRLEDLILLLKYLRKHYPQQHLRLNTNGLSDLQYNRPTAQLFDGLLDTVSISLNHVNAEEYLNITRSIFGIKSYEAMLNFATEIKKYVPEVILSVVDVLEKPLLEESRRICESRGLTLRIRHFES